MSQAELNLGFVSQQLIGIILMVSVQAVDRQQYK